MEDARRRFERLGWYVARLPFEGSRYHGRDPCGRQGTVDLDQQTWLAWGEAPSVRPLAALEAAAARLAETDLDRLVRTIRERWPDVFVDAAGALVAGCGEEAVCTDRRSGTQFLVRTLADVERICGPPPPKQQRSLF